MNEYYYNNEKKRYVNTVTMRKGYKDDPPIYNYNGYDPFKILTRHLVRTYNKNKILRDNKLYISNFALATNYSCNLNCRGCAQHEPMIKRLPEERLRVDLDRVFKDVDKISDAVSGIAAFAMANGEGFLNTNLTGIIDYFASNDKIATMNVPTNGTIIPDENVLKKMADNNVTATITRYDTVPDEKRQALMRVFDDYGVRYTLFNERKWQYHEYLEDIICDEEEAEIKYRNCERFFMLIGGRLYKCVVNATGIMAGLRPEREGDSICVAEASTEDIGRFIEIKSNLKHLESCLHCRGMCGSNVVDIPAGAQMSMKEIEEGRYIFK